MQPVPHLVCGLGLFTVSTWRGSEGKEGSTGRWLSVLERPLSLLVVSYKASKMADR